jgi:hypothetical protein
MLEWLQPNFSDDKVVSGYDYPLGAFLVSLVSFALIFPIRVPPIRAAIVMVLIVETMMHVRHEVLLAVIATIILAEPIAKGSRAETGCCRSVARSSYCNPCCRDRWWRVWRGQACCAIHAR